MNALHLFSVLADFWHPHHRRVASLTGAYWILAADAPGGGLAVPFTGVR